MLGVVEKWNNKALAVKELRWRGTRYGKPSLKYDEAQADERLPAGYEDITAEGDIMEALEM